MFHLLYRFHALWRKGRQFAGDWLLQAKLFAKDRTLAIYKVGLGWRIVVRCRANRRTDS